MAGIGGSLRDRAVVQIFDGPGNPFRMEVRPLPRQLGYGEVLVATTLATVCSSDLHTVKGRRGAPVPCVLGHEGVGRVIAAGQGRPDVAPGARVTWSVVDSCGLCAACKRHHLPEKCQSLFKYGHAALGDGSGLNGCYASHILLRPGTHVVPVPESIPDPVVAPANCALATMVNVVSQLPDPCETVVIQGAGLLGLYGCALLRERGVKRVFCLDPCERRVEAVSRFGGIPMKGVPGDSPAVRATILDSAPCGVDAVIEVAGDAATVPEGIQLLRPGGLYVFAGMVHPESALQITGEQVIRKCLTIRGVHNYSPRHLDEAICFLARTLPKYPYASLVSPSFALADLESAFSLAAEQKFFRVTIESEYG